MRLERAAAHVTQRPADVGEGEEKLALRLQEVADENARLQAENETLQTENSKQREKLDQLQIDFDGLQDAFRKLKQDYFSLQERSESAGQQLDLAINDLSAILDSDQQGAK